jgi:class 3 adenylate cyclase
VPASSVRRRLATVFFLDIVGSTALATELGDARWRELLTRFRRLVRRELKRYGGSEQDTSGDGFFATFSQPMQALRAAAAIAGAV